MDKQQHRDTNKGSQRSYHKYTFFKVDKAWRSLSKSKKESTKTEFVNVINDFSQRLSIRCFSLVGIRGDTDFMIWSVTTKIEDIHQLGCNIFGTSMARYVDIPYSYLAMSKPSPYFRSSPIDSKVEGMSKFVFVYPFIKKKEWYRLPLEKRVKIMREHSRIGLKYPVKIHTGYSFGIDDQEFMLAFEADDPIHFLDLVEDLRHTEASSYTLLETPIFTCLAKDAKGMMDALG